MGDLFNYIEILIMLNMFRYLLASTQTAEYNEYYDNGTNDFLVRVPRVVSRENATLEELLNQPSTVSTENEKYNDNNGSNNNETNLFPVPRVVNGAKAKAGEFPYQIALKKSVGMNIYMTFCGGALISPKTILTAAHCFVVDANWLEKRCLGKSVTIELARKYAVAGTLKNKEMRYKDKTQQWRTMVDVIAPSYYKFPNNDIALAITVKPFILNNHVGLIPYAVKDQDYGRIKCVVSGYGRISNTETASFLMWARLDLLERPKCDLWHGKDMKHFICTASWFTDVLHGDSGGPLVCYNTNDPNDFGQGVVVGVVSGARMPGGTFFTRVSSFRHLIESNASVPTINETCLCILISYYIKLFL